MLDVLDGAKATWVGRVRPFAIFFSLFCLQLSTRPAHIPAQEFGRWTPPFSRDGIARLKSTPLCDIPFLPSPARVNVLLFATTRTGTPDLHARSHPCSRIGAMVHSFLTQRHRQAEEYASSRLSPRSCAPGPQPAALRDEHASTMPSRDPLATPSLLKKLDSSWAGSTVPRTQARGWPRAPIPTQEFGGWMCWMVRRPKG